VEQVHDGVLGVLAVVVLPTYFTLRHTGSCFLFGVGVGCTLAAAGAAWLLMRYAWRAAPFYAPTLASPLVLLPLSHQLLSAAVDDWRHSLLHEPLAAQRGYDGHAFASRAVPPVAADRRTTAHRCGRPHHFLNIQ
jgi:hypothetical protein